MNAHDCEHAPPVRPPSGTASALGDYERLQHVMVDFVKMDDGRWLVSLGSWVPGPTGSLVETQPQAVFITNPPSYLNNDCDLDVWLAADLISNVVLHQTKERQSPTQGGRFTTEMRSKM